MNDRRSHRIAHTREAEHKNIVVAQTTIDGRPTTNQIGEPKCGRESSHVRPQLAREERRLGARRGLEASGVTKLISDSILKKTAH